MQIKRVAGGGERDSMLSAAHFRSEALNCRALAKVARDPMIAKNLLDLAKDYEAQARKLDQEVVAEAPLPRPE